jgi:AmmeMemoRadiSam system protein B
MSHYHTDQIAKSIDRNTLNLVEQMKIDQLYQEGVGPERSAELCGLGPVLTVMQAFNSSGSGKVQILNARNSYGAYS